MDLPSEVLNQFSWHEISIQKDHDGNCFLILATTEAKAALIYDIISVCHLTLEVYIDDETKTYSIKLIFPYNKEKAIEYSYDTKLTSDIYPSLLWLNNGTVSFITTGTQSDANPNHFFYKRPLLPLSVKFNPN